MTALRPVSDGWDIEDYKQATTDAHGESRAWTSAGTGSGVAIVSVDSHVGAPVKAYRDYCPSALLDEFDEFNAAHEAAHMQIVQGYELALANEEAVIAEMPLGLSIAVLMSEDGINHISPRRLRRMDEDGISAEVIYHGGEDFIPVPFLGLGEDDLPEVPELSGLVGAPWKQGARGAELALAGMRMYNRWLADFCAEAPDRYLGLALVPMWDVELAVEEVKFAREAGLVGINFPAPRPALPSYNDPVWEPLWSACESLNMTLNTHIASAGRTVHLGAITGVNPGGPSFLDLGYTSRRGIPMMIYGLVFERHPGLKLLITETAANWVPGMLRDLDSMQPGFSKALSTEMPKRPSDYFLENVFIGDSFMSNHEARTAVEDGTESNVLWGRDYPHAEGTWPYTKHSVRMLMEGIPEQAARQMLGLNAVDVFGLDAAKIQTVADRVGPTIEEVMTPLTSDELPGGRNFCSGFRVPGQNVV
jgi:predicted TIM-barrel fold metal-dependent hydrolase